jgi:hypothetical protein
MKQHLVWALVCAGCGGDSFSADGQKATADGATPDSGGAPSVVQLDDDAGSAGAPSGGSAGEDAGGSGGTGGERVEDAGPDVEGGAGGTGGSDGGGAGGTHSAGAGGDGGLGGVGGVGGAGGSSTGGTGGCEVTHDNGVGQTWQDCVPLGTYDNTQALKACEAWCAVVGCASCWTAPACNQTLVVMSEIESGGDTTRIAWSRTSDAVWQVGTLGCISAGTWR